MTSKTQPEDQAPEPLALEASLDRPEIPAQEGETELKCQLRLWPTLEPRDADAPPVVTSVCILLDCTTLVGAHLEAAKDATKGILDSLEEGQRISVVALESRCRSLAENARATSAAKEKTKLRVDELESGGATPMTDGIELGLRALGKGEPGARVMMTLSDAAVDFANEAQKAAKATAAAGAQLLAAGIGPREAAGDLPEPENGIVVAVSDAVQAERAFRALGRRIDRLVATNARLVITLEEGVRTGLVYKTKPERILLGALTVGAGRQVELPIGNIERNQTHAFLLPIKVPTDRAGEREVARAQVRYDVPSTGARGVHTDVRIAVLCTNDPEGQQAEGEPAAEADGDGVDEALRNATVVQLTESLLDAHRQGSLNLCVQYLQLLSRRSQEAGDSEMTMQYALMLEELEAGSRLTKEMLAACSLAKAKEKEKEATAPGKSAATLYDVVLVEPGERPIRVARELRDATGLSLAEITQIIESRQATIAQAKGFAEAGALQRRIQAAGAQVEVRRRGGDKSDTPD